MNKYIGLGFILFSAGLQAAPLVGQNSTSVANDQTYYTAETEHTKLIFTEQNKTFAQQAAALEPHIHQYYQKTFGFALDDRLNVGLMSSYNQIANGFSTQFPLNRQINYLGGAQRVDYFSSTSWLDTLLIHETAHNYQTNAKDNPVSRSLFSVLKNGSLFTPVFPAITPNIFESSFLLEGNAVLNESGHGNGGRLYNGRYRAMTHVHAKANYLTPERLYNATLNFPYGEGFYIFGSQYQYYLAEQYGLDKVNQYFKNRSRYWFWPFMVNRPMQNTLGINFNNSFADWVYASQQQAEKMTLASGEKLASSKYFSQMNRQEEQILFLTNPTAVRAPKLNQYQINNGALTQQTSSLDLGKVFKLDDENYAISARRTSVWRTYQGLYDDDGLIKDDTQGKIIQGFLTDGRAVYFDSAKSFDQPQLYIGDSFYAQVNSSVIVDNDSLYYFIQQGDTRVLYKNRQVLTRFKGYYGIVADVDKQGRVYFIANSEFGSSLYRINNGQVERVLAADNIVDAKLAGDKILATSVTADEYIYTLESLSPNTQSPYVVNLLWDNSAEQSEQPQTHHAKIELAKTTDKTLTTEHKYGVFNNLEYSAGHFALSTVTKESDNDEDEVETTYSISAQISDPLDRTQIAFWAMRDSDLSDLIGVGFSNNQSFVLAGINAFYVANDGFEDESQQDTREFGVAAQLRFPFLQTGFWQAELDANYYQDYQLAEREPVSLALKLNRLEHYGHSWLYNKAFMLSAYSVDDRGSQITGAELLLSTDLPYEFYLQAQAKYAETDLTIIDPLLRKGVELKDNIDFINNDPSSFTMPSLIDDVYAKSVSFAEISASKVFNLSAYSFKSPISLRREKLTLAMRQFDIKQANNLTDIKINQAVLGVDFDLLLMNKMNVIFGVQYIYSDDDTVTEQNQFQAGFNIPL
ncbi:hypothetical protein N7931_06135 [Catenovulum sp. 2E275]|uniref:hypothetical protein n=1 Tax=Catenovulum sp. 2E275 TaxID=2980497 RepID=UPI0021D14BA2|nr:hypothetical protein [Catenovulum sp. 2E275]MCU4675208.1 hypothetical protein [Catenovulum sp. 2E275]